MLDAFKIKPFDLEPIFTTWTDGPHFNGNPKKDMPVDDWLKQIKDGCVQRNIPEECWHKVAQHFMGSKAKARLDELKAVITKVHGGKYRWTWKKFTIAMQSMGWGIDDAATETIKVQGKGSGLWFMRKKEDKEVPDISPPPALPPTRPSSIRSESSFWGSRKSSKEDINEPVRPVPTRSSTDIFWPRRNSKDETKEDPPKGKSDAVVSSTRSVPKPSPPSRSNTADPETVTTITNAPIWLLNACSALEYITSEHPKAMSVISAILITAGSLPAIPAISAGAGGAVLASGAAHAIGAIAVGLGQALSSSVKNQHDSQTSTQASSTVR